MMSPLHAENQKEDSNATATHATRHKGNNGKAFDSQQST
jgi:hypothetical protein